MQAADPAIIKQTQRVKQFKQREARILATALELFLKLGEDKVTVEMIADEVGIGKGTIYKHFTTKAEIYLQLMLSYEKELAELLQSQQTNPDKSALARVYFEFRMQEPDKYLLFNRLEEKLTKTKVIPELIEELHSFRAKNLTSLSGLIDSRIEEGYLEDVPSYFHYSAYWAFVHGAAMLYQSEFFQEIIEDKQEFFNFMMDIGARLGNKGQRGKKPVQK